MADLGEQRGQLLSWVRKMFLKEDKSHEQHELATSVFRRGRSRHTPRREEHHAVA